MNGKAKPNLIAAWYIYLDVQLLHLLNLYLN